MSKKMKRVAFDPSPHVLNDAARAKFKHQSLLQDYLELQQETESAKAKLMGMKRKKLTLQAEVSFLRRRYNFLLKTKSSTPTEQVTIKPYQTTQIRKGKKEKVDLRKEATLRNLPPIHKLNQKGRVFTVKKNSIRKIPSHLDPQESLQRSNGMRETLRNNASSFPDVNQKESSFNGKEGTRQGRAPMIDLNQISREEEEMEEEPMRKGLVDEENTEMKLSVCRNTGEASTSGSGKRKISWQDPVALRV